MSEYPQGATVQFTGGVGRGNDGHDATIHTGIVNGATKFLGGTPFVPVHVRETNRNLMVVSTNIVKVVAA